jgi:hypothetical protein
MAPPAGMPPAVLGHAGTAAPRAGADDGDDLKEGREPAAIAPGGEMRD